MKPLIAAVALAAAAAPAFAMSLEPRGCRTPQDQVTVLLKRAPTLKAHYLDRRTSRDYLARVVNLPAPMHRADRVLVILLPGKAKPVVIYTYRKGCWVGWAFVSRRNHALIRRVIDWPQDL